MTIATSLLSGVGELRLGRSSAYDGRDKPGGGLNPAHCQLGPCKAALELASLLSTLIKALG